MSLAPSGQRQSFADRAGGGDDLSVEQIQELREAFSLFDKDGDGSITSEELGVVIRSLGLNPTEEDLNEMVMQADVDGDGTIDRDEFVTMMALRMRNVDPDLEYKQAWEVFSCGHEFIPVDTLRRVFVNLGETVTDDSLDQLVREADMDGDGRISYDDFLACMKAGKGR